jgi:hypothetical protein
MGRGVSPRSTRLHRQQPADRGVAGLVRLGEDRLAEDDELVGVEEHVLGPREADALRAELARACRVDTGVGVGPDAEAAIGVGQREDFVEVRVVAGGGGRDGAHEDFARGAVDGDHLALGVLLAGQRHDARVEVDVQLGDGGDAGLADLPRDDGGVGGHPAARGEDAGGDGHALEVLRRGLDPDEQHVLALGGPLRGLLRVEDGHALRTARARLRYGGGDAPVMLPRPSLVHTEHPFRDGA